MEGAHESDALSSGRRIYLGNLPYTANPYDIESLLATNGFHHLENIHIAIDPISARNPGYCFVDFPDRETADRALNSLTAFISDRLIKVGPCEPKKRNYDPSGEGHFAFKRWGDWTSRSSDSVNPTSQKNNKRIAEGPCAALSHFDDMVQHSEGRKLYVGGLGKMINQAQHNTEITRIFAGFTPTAIGKRITPHENTKLLSGNHHYCFVDFETKEEADAARRAINGILVDGNKLKVALANPIPEKLAHRRDNVRRSRWEHDERNMRSTKFKPDDTTTSNRSTLSSNWRKGENT